jgi:hypothetical protein
LCASLAGLVQAPLQTVGWLLGQTHLPALQLAPAGHRLPQWPQLFGSLAVLVQMLPQSCWPVGQTQAPLTQVAVAGQALAHLPQLLASVCRLTQTPLQRV